MKLVTHWTTGNYSNQSEDRSEELHYAHVRLVKGWAQTALFCFKNVVFLRRIAETVFNFGGWSFQQALHCNSSVFFGLLFCSDQKLTIGGSASTQSCQHYAWAYLLRVFFQVGINQHNHICSLNHCNLFDPLPFQKAFKMSSPCNFSINITSRP